MIETLFNTVLQLIDNAGMLWGWLITPLTFTVLGIQYQFPFAPLSAIGSGFLVLVGFLLVKKLFPGS